MMLLIARYDFTIILHITCIILNRPPSGTSADAVMQQRKVIEVR